MPAAEAGHRWLMRLYIDLGRRDAALAQYELCQRSLAVTYGRAPSPETRALHETALSGAAQLPRAPVVADLPSDAGSRSLTDRAAIAATSFVGRLEELGELERLFADKACRLITLHGLGGTGKTRLAHVFAMQVQAQFAQGVLWVSLETADSSDALATVVAEAMGRQLPQRGDRAEIVAGMLARQQRLLVLDNFESLLKGGENAEADSCTVVLKILQLAPRVRIVITSREVLGLQEEWIYELRGLAYVTSEARAPAQENTPAVELFAQRARQAYRGFALAAEMPHVLRICGLVEGLPLGIELAAAWVRTIPCAELAAAIEAEAGALASAHRNRPGRHSSLDAVIASSWKLLSDEQRAALAGLGVFVGGFTREAAEPIAQASLRTLSALTDKSFVRRRADGRYDLHELVRQFALARLRDTPARHAAVIERHGDFFAVLLLRLIEQLRGPTEVAADALMRSELANILAAMDTVVEAARLDLIERMAAAVVALLYARGTLPAALAEAEQAINALTSSRRADVIGAVRMEWGRAAIGLDYAVAQRELEAALAQARRDGAPDLIARCLYYAGSFDYKQGNIDAAQARADEAFALAADSHNAELRTVVHYMCGEIADARSQFDLAETLTRKAVAAARERGSPALIGGMLCSLGGTLYLQGKFAESRALTTEAAELYETIGRHTVATTIRNNLAAIALAQGDVPAAQQNVDIAVRLAREAGDEQQLASALANLADVLIRSGDIGRARATLCGVLATGGIRQSAADDHRSLVLARGHRHRGATRRGSAVPHTAPAGCADRAQVRCPGTAAGACHRRMAAVNGHRTQERCVALAGSTRSTGRHRCHDARQGAQLLVREGATAGEDAREPEAGLSLPELQGEVVAFLAGLAQTQNDLAVAPYLTLKACDAPISHASTARAACRRLRIAHRSATVRAAGLPAAYICGIRSDSFAHGPTEGHPRWRQHPNWRLSCRTPRRVGEEGDDFGFELRERNAYGI